MSMATTVPEQGQPLLIDTGTAAHRLGIGLTKMRELMKEGGVETVRIDRRILVVAESCGAYVDRLRAEQAMTS